MRCERALCRQAFWNNLLAGKYRETCRVEKNCKTKYDCIVDADESTKKRMEVLLKNHEDHIAAKGMKTMSHHNLVRKFVLMLQSF